MVAKRQHVIYGDSLFSHKPTLKYLVWHYFYNKFVNLERHKQSIYRDKAYFLDKTITMDGLEVTYLALIINSKVAEILKMKSETANLVKSTSKKFVEFNPDTTIVKVGMTYDGEFKNAQED
jgi:uncharacterized membrane protein